MTRFGLLRREFPPLLALAGPLVLGELGWMTMGFVDTMMVGRISKEAIGAVSIAGIVYFTVAMFGVGILLSLDTVVSQAFGAGRLADCHQWLLNAIYLSLPLTPILMLVAWSGGLLFGPLGVDPAVRREAGPYLDALIWSVFPLLLYSALRRYLQGMGLVKPVMFSLLSANLVNLAADWVFIFGHFGMTAYGTAGAGWATLASRVYMMAVLAGYLVWRNRRHGLRLGSTPLAPEFAWIRRMLGLGLPAAAQILVEIGVFALMTMLVGHLEPQQLAAHQIALIAASYTFMLPMGIGSAAAVRVGQALGREQAGEARHAGWAALILVAGLMSCAATCFLLIPGWIARIFTTDQTVIAAAATLLSVAAAFQVFDGLQGVATGVLRGAGDTRTPAICHFACYWGIGLPLGYYLCFFRDWKATGIWAGLGTALITIGSVLTVFWWRKSRSWKASG